MMQGFVSTFRLEKLPKFHEKVVELTVLLASDSLFVHFRVPLRAFIFLSFRPTHQPRRTPLAVVCTLFFLRQILKTAAFLGHTCGLLRVI